MQCFFPFENKNQTLQSIDGKMFCNFSYLPTPVFGEYARILTNPQSITTQIKKERKKEKNQQHDLQIEFWEEMSLFLNKCYSFSKTLSIYWKMYQLKTEKHFNSKKHLYNHFHNYTNQTNSYNLRRLGNFWFRQSNFQRSWSMAAKTHRHNYENGCNINEGLVSKEQLCWLQEWTFDNCYIPYAMPSIVIDASAMFVATTTW